jgi:hypothetical protein
MKTATSAISSSPSNLIRPRPGGPVPAAAACNPKLTLTPVTTASTRYWWETANRAPALL